MKVARGQIALAIDQLSRDTAPSRLAKVVAAYLLGEHRTGELDSLMRDLMEVRARKGIVEVTAISAHALETQAKQDIKAEVLKLYPDAREVIISPRIDRSLIGGVRLEFANAQLDLSLRNKLNQMRQLITYGKDI